MRYLIFIVVFHLFISVSCKEKNRKLIVSIAQDSIFIDNEFINNKFRVSNEADKVVFQGYNPSSNELLLLNLDNRKVEMKTRLPIDFRDTTIGRLIQILIYKPDSIFLLTENHILITDTTGKIGYDKKLTEVYKDTEGEEILFIDYQNYFPLYFDSKNGDLLLHTMRLCPYTERKYYYSTIEAKLHLATGQVDLFNYSFPARYRQHSYGQAIFPFRAVNGPLSIVSFESEDSLYVFDRKQNKLHRYYCKSRYQKHDFVPFDTSFNNDLERVKDHLTINPLYEKIIYDKFRKLYYRFYLKELPLKDKNGVYTNLLNKEVVIMVLDEGFNILEEKNVEDSYLWYYSFVTEKGLYLQKKDDAPSSNTNNKYAYFTIFSFD